jgi:hypothetical protein
MIVEINFFSVFFDVESEYGVGLSLTITIFVLEGVAIIFSNPVYLRRILFYFEFQVKNLKVFICDISFKT